MILLEKKEQCSGCSACYNICPVNAIEMSADEEGFEYPKINNNICIDCGACKRVCQFNAEYDISDNLDAPIVYGLKHKNDEIRNTSRSGGAFFAFASYILSVGGVVYGVALDESIVPKHIRVTEKCDLVKLQGVKYVEAEIDDTFKLVKKDLENGKTVLFGSTACKIAGLESYIESSKLRDNLITIDLICHGVPSRRIFKDYLNYQNKRFFSKIQTFNFRDKAFGWNTHLESFVLKNGKKIVSSMYRNIFFSECILRPSCYNCCYTNKKRPADITLGDFWEINNVSKEFNDNAGVSCVILNTKKAIDIYENIRENVCDIESSIEVCNQINLNQPTPKPEKRELFWNTYKKKGFIKAAEAVFGKFYGAEMTLKSYIRMIRK